MFGIFKKLKQKSENINTYCWDAMKSYVFLKDSVGFDAMMAALIVMGETQRASMITAIDGFTSAIKNDILMPFESQNEMKEIEINIQEIKEALQFVKSKKWTVSDVWKVKLQLTESEKAAEVALSGFDADYLRGNIIITLHFLVDKLYLLI